MDTLQKGVLSVEGETLHLGMPFNKVNKAKRTVSGYATLDNVDTQGDIVLADASAKAFARARGNLREMHKKDSAVGRIVDFKERSVFDKESGKEYRGIYVTARVSEGAENTWLKVLDGTLSGFSIGGEINEATNEFSKDAGKTVRVISDFDLTELSLVDNPANQLANVDKFEKSVFTMNKSADGSVESITGMVADTKIENVFICKSDDTVVVEEADSVECPKCSAKMDNAGWFENGPNRTEKVRDILNDFLTPADREAAPDIAKSEGGVEMNKSKDKDDTTTVPNNPNTQPAGTPDEVHVSNTEPDVDETEGTEVEKAAEPVEVVEVTDDETEISKKIDELHDAVKDSLEKSREDTNTTVAALEKKIDELNGAFIAKTSELDDKLNEFGQKLEVAKGRLTDFEKSLDSINSSEAFRKSADYEESAEPVQKSKTLWGPGTFSGDSLFR